MANNRIENLESMVCKYIEKGATIIETKITNLMLPGENYGSKMYKVDIKMKNKNGEIEDLNVVAKQIPETEFYQTIFNIQVTFNAEREFYTTIIPTLHEFQREKNMEILDIFPTFFGARNNLNGTDNVVDKDAVIVLENLNIKGYKNLDRSIGFDLHSSRLILKNMAQMHAVILALKHAKVDVFEKRVKPFCACFLKRPPKIDMSHEIEELSNLLKETKSGERLLEKFKQSMRCFTEIPVPNRERFATLSHRDFWVNNIMVSLENDIVTKVKIVDFQMYTYDSLAKDLIFFLSTSVETETLKENFDHLLQYYYSVVVETLRHLECDIASFSYRDLLQEIAVCMRTELGKIIFMLVFIVRGPKGGHLKNNDPKEIPKLNTQHLTPGDRDRLFWLIEEFQRRKWTEWF